MTNNKVELHSSIVSMISLSAAIASRHPDMGHCQLERLKQAGIPENQINTVIEVAHHIRDEASRKFDNAFDQKSDSHKNADKKLKQPNLNQLSQETCCTLSPQGKKCC